MAKGSILVHIPDFISDRSQEFAIACITASHAIDLFLQWPVIGIGTLRQSAATRGTPAGILQFQRTRIIFQHGFHRCPADLYRHLARLLIFGGPSIELPRIRAILSLVCVSVNHKPLRPNRR